jgi:CspA family cold shock protein
MQGVVKWFSSTKGFGFIAGENGVDIFCHYLDVEGDGERLLVEGEQVDYGRAQDAQG